MYAPLILQYLPVVFFLFICLYINRRRGIKSIPISIVALFSIVIVIALAFFPEELNYDKPRYTSSYLNASNYSYMISDYKDMGWPYYLFLCSRIFGRDVDSFYIFTATLYFSGYFFFAQRYFSRNIMGYFVIFSAGCLGFTAYGVNTIRAGVALSFLFYSITFYDYKSVKFKLLSLAFAILAILIHKSMLIPLAGFFLSIFVKNIKVVIAFWGFCFLLSALNFDLSGLFEYFGFVDERIGSYIEGVNERSSYKSGFRIDFIIYSLVPILLSWYYIKIKNIKDDFFSHLLKMYLFTNGVWLLAIRVHYSDRLAYLSWFLIPVLLLVPICNNQKNFKNPQNMVLMVMAIFMVLPLLLALRD